jgi:hypothetical protein
MKAAEKQTTGPSTRDSDKFTWIWVSSTGDQAQCHEHVGKCWVNEPYHQCRNSTSTLSCMNLENLSTERLQVIKTSNQLPGLRCVNPNAETQEIWKSKATWYLHTHSNNDSELEEISKKKFKTVIIKMINRHE